MGDEDGNGTMAKQNFRSQMESKKEVVGEACRF